MTYDRVLVFGATGSIGSVVAKNAVSLGAHVALVVRDLNKPIRGLDAAAEQSGKYERVKADFSDNEAVTAAAQKSQAKSAFVYLAHGSNDHQLSFFEALKAGGIEFVVFLSSFSVQGELSKIAPSDFLSYVHAQAEISLARVFGDNHVAVRPAAFATNTVREKASIKAGRVKLFHPQNKTDYITPDDMGEVAARLLVKGPIDGQKAVHLFGARLMSATEAYETIGRVLHGKPLEIDRIPTVEAAVKKLLSQGVSPPIANYLAQSNEQGAQGDLPFKFGADLIAESHVNIEKYLGRKPLEFADWVAKNKDLYLE